MTLNVDLMDGFDLGSVIVEPKKKAICTANHIYQVVGSLSDTNNTLMSNNVPPSQVSLVRVCVTPGKEATVDGIYMRSIDEFTWRQNNTEASQAGMVGRNKKCIFTSINSEGGYSVKLFSSLVGQFFGGGVTSMQFGSTHCPLLHDGDCEGWSR